MTCLSVNQLKCLHIAGIWVVPREYSSRLREILAGIFMFIKHGRQKNINLVWTTGKNTPVLFKGMEDKH